MESTPMSKNTKRSPHARVVRALAPLTGCAALAASASAQVVTFSVDWKSPSISLPNSFTGVPITEADILAPVTLAPALGPLPPPGVLETGGFVAPAGLGLGLYAGCVGHPPGFPCGVEVDALSHGMDRPEPNPTGALSPGRSWAFSVDF